MASTPSTITLKSTYLFISLILLLQVFKANGHGGHDDDEDAGGHVDLHSRGLVLVKVWCLIILLVSTFAGGVSPYFFRWNETFLLLGTQFAGGVFLGTSLMHFLSDSNESFEDLTTKKYPFAFMLASTGYLLTMLGDCIIHLVTKSSQREAKVEIEEGRRRTPNKNDDHDHVDLEEVNPVFVRTTSLGDTILLIVALCFHSVFEGIAVGIAGNIILKYKLFNELFLINVFLNAKI